MQLNPSLSFMTSEDDAERIFRELAQGGRVVVPIGKTFCAQRYKPVCISRFLIPSSLTLVRDLPKVTLLSARRGPYFPGA
jgi:hypothetical protein